MGFWIKSERGWGWVEHLLSNVIECSLGYLFYDMKDRARAPGERISKHEAMLDGQLAHYQQVFDLLIDILPTTRIKLVQKAQNVFRRHFIGIVGRGVVRPAPIHTSDHSIRRKLSELVITAGGNVTNAALCQLDAYFYEQVLRFESPESLVDKLLLTYLESIGSGPLSERSRQIILRLIFLAIVKSDPNTQKAIYIKFKNQLSAQYDQTQNYIDDDRIRILETLEILTLSVRYPVLVQLYYLVYQVGTPEFQGLSFNSSIPPYVHGLQGEVEKTALINDLDGDAANPPSRAASLYSFFDIHNLSFFLRSLNELEGGYLNSGDGVIADPRNDVDVSLQKSVLRTLSVSTTTVPRFLAFYLQVTDHKSMSTEHKVSDLALLHLLCDTVTDMFIDFFKVTRTGYPPIHASKNYNPETQAWNAWDIICQLVKTINSQYPGFWDLLLGKFISADRENATGREKGMILPMQLDKLARLIITNAPKPTKAVDWYYDTYLSSLIEKVIGYEVGGLGSKNDKLFETADHLVKRVKKRDKSFGNLDNPSPRTLTENTNWFYETHRLIDLYIELVKIFMRKIENLPMLTAGFSGGFESLSPSIQQALLLKATILEVESTTRFSEIKEINKKYAECGPTFLVSQLNLAVNKILSTQSEFVQACSVLDYKLSVSVTTTYVNKLRHELTVDVGS